MKKVTYAKLGILLGVSIVVIILIVFKDDIFSVKPNYEDAHSFSEGLVAVKVNDKWGGY